MRMFSQLKKAAPMFLAALSMACMASNSAADITIEGDYCWNIKVNERDEGAITPETYPLKLHIVPLGNGTILSMAGKVFPPGDNPPILSGTAIVGATNISGNLVASQLHLDTWRDTSVIQVTINSATLNGTFFEVGHDFDRGNHNFSERYSSGKLIPRACSN